MNLRDITAAELTAQVTDNSGLLKKLSESLYDLHEKGRDLNVFISFDKQHLEQETAALAARLARGERPSLAGIPAVLADNICTVFYPTTCASKMLAEYRPPFSARLVESLQQKGALITGKTNMEEFGLGCSGNSSHYGVAKNPWEAERTAGSGAAAAVSTSSALLAFATDTVGELRQSASFCGVLAIRPSYGRISRSGVIDYASSMEQVGVAARTTTDLALALEAAAGPDPRDPTSLKAEAPPYASLLESGEGKLKAAVPESWDRASGLEDGVKDCFQSELEQIKAMGIEVDFVELKHFREAPLAAAVISAVEAFSNLANMDGVRFGCRGSAASLQEMYTVSRSEAFSSKLKKFIGFGALVSSEKYYRKHFLKSQRMRTRIKDELAACLEEYDLLLTPTTPFAAPLAGGSLDAFHLLDPANFYTAAPALAGLPALTFPVYTDDGLPAGLQLIGETGDETALLRASLRLEKGRSPLKFPEPGSM